MTDETKPETIHADASHKKKNSTIINEKLNAVKPKAAKDKYYVDNAKFYQELSIYIKKCNEIEAVNPGLTKEELCKFLPKPNSYIGMCLMQIANRLASMHQFSAYSYKEDMIGDAIENCITYIRNFNPEKSKNPFAYFTQIVYYAFIRRIQIEKKQAYIRYKGIVNALADPSSQMEIGTDNPDVGLGGGDNMKDAELGHIKEYVATFEEKNNIKPKATEKPKAIIKKSQVKSILTEYAQEQKNKNEDSSDQ